VSSRGSKWFIVEEIYEQLAGYFPPGPQMISTLLFSLDSSVICELKDVPGNSNDWIVLKETLLGCWTNFTTRDNEREVHILNLLYTHVSRFHSEIQLRPAAGKTSSDQYEVVQTGLVLADQTPTLALFEYLIQK